MHHSAPPKTMKRPARRQQGLSAVGFLGLLVGIVVVITLVLKLAPHYLDYYTLNSVIEGLPANDVRTMSRSDFNKTLEKRFKINNLRNLPIRDIMTFDRSRDGTVLEVKYEQREHLFFNVDVVLTFEKRFEY